MIKEPNECLIRGVVPFAMDALCSLEAGDALKVLAHVIQQDERKCLQLVSGSITTSNCKVATLLEALSHTFQTDPATTLSILSNISANTVEDVHYLIENRELLEKTLLYL